MNLIQRLKKTKANLSAEVLTVYIRQRATKKHMRVFTIQRIWRRWAIPLSLEFHNVSYLSVNITRLTILCFMFEYEVMNLNHQDMVEQNLTNQLKEV